MLADLAISGHIVLDGASVHARHHAPTGDPNLDRLVHRVAAERRARTAKWWVNKVHSGRLFLDLLKHAVAHGVLAYEQRPHATEPYQEHYPPARPGQREELIRRLREAANPHAVAADARTAALMAMDHAMYGGYTVPNLDRQSKRRVRTMTHNDPIGRSVKSAVKQYNPPARFTPGITVSP